MNWYALEAFASLSETLSFTQTARQLGVTQPNISKLISALEAELEVSLFNRNRKQVSLTPAGLELKKEFLSRHQELREAMVQFQSRQKGIAGKIRVAALPELGLNIIYPHLLRFQLKNPRIQIKVVYCAESEILAGLTNGLFDLGFCARGETSERFRAHAVLTENICLLGTPKMIEKLQAGHWKKAPWIEPVEGDTLTSGFLSKYRKKLPFQEHETRLIVNSHRSMVQALLAEVGFAILPKESAQIELASKKLISFPDLDRKDTIYLLMANLERIPDRIKEARNHFLQLKNAVALY